MNGFSILHQMVTGQTATPIRLNYQGAFAGSGSEGMSDVITDKITTHGI